jgi:cytochrome c
MYKFAMLTAFLIAAAAAVGAHDTTPSDLKKLPGDHQVQTVSFCKGVYSITLVDGSSYQFPEFNLRFKTDSSANGPKPLAPVILPSGMSGDRVFLIFSGPAEISALIKLQC